VNQVNWVAVGCFAIITFNTTRKVIIAAMANGKTVTVMADFVEFVMDFLDWLSDIWNGVIDSTKRVAAVIMVIAVVILTIPLWILPFGFWLVFVKLKGGEDDG